MDNKKDLSVSKYMYETIASGADNQLPVSSVCNGRCIFCSNKMNPFPIFNEGFRPLEDIKKGLALLSGNSEIRMGDSLPGRISEGEALLHPEIIDILKLVRERFPSTPIQISTNGVILDEEMAEKLVPFKPMKFTVSYHSDKPENWCRIFNLGEDKFKTARSSFFHLVKRGFTVEGALVPLPALVGYEDIENTIRTLRMFTNKVIIYPPGYSKLVTEDLRKIMAVDFEALSRFISLMRKKYKVALDLMTDVLSPLDFYPEQVMRESFFAGFKNVLWLFSEGSFQRASKVLNDFNAFLPNEHHAFMVRNTTYGGNIICSGLLMVSDYRSGIENALKTFSEKDVKIDLIILPRVSFDRYGDDLSCNNYSALSGEFKMPVWLK